MSACPFPGCSGYAQPWVHGPSIASTSASTIPGHFLILIWLLLSCRITVITLDLNNPLQGHWWLEQVLALPVLFMYVTWWLSVYSKYQNPPSKMGITRRATSFIQGKNEKKSHTIVIFFSIEPPTSTKRVHGIYIISLCSANSRNKRHVFILRNLGDEMGLRWKCLGHKSHLAEKGNLELWRDSNSQDWSQFLWRLFTPCSLMKVSVRTWVSQQHMCIGLSL